MAKRLTPKTVAELVEGLLFLQAVARKARRKGQCFDKLSMDGSGPDLTQPALTRLLAQRIDHVVEGKQRG
jgi:hypothetical protein